MTREAIDPSQGLLWVVVEQSDVGDTTVGVFTTLEAARDVLRDLGGKLDAYRIEGHAVDQPKREATPWQVVLGRGGDVVSTTPFIGCNCQDDEAEYFKRSFIERGGETMYVIAFAVTPGGAIDIANQYREWLQANGHWSEDGAPLAPVHARTPVEAGATP